MYLILRYTGSPIGPSARCTSPNFSHRAYGPMYLGYTCTPKTPLFYKSGSSDDEIPSATTFGGKEATLEPAELDEDGMISRRARLLAGRQAKKEYIEYKDQHKKEIKKTHGYAISSDSDEKDKSENEALAIESEESEANESEESEVESSESDDIVPKMKPIFTKKKDRLTLEDDEDVAQRNAEIEERAEKAGDDRRSWTLKVLSGICVCPNLGHNLSVTDLE